MIRPADQAFLEWSNISYFVPQGLRESLKSSIAPSKDSEKGLPPAVVKTFDGSSKKYKQIVHNSSGYVCPHEMVAIMGPSGSGKTTLLNVVSQRTFLTPGGKA